MVGCGEAQSKDLPGPRASETISTAFEHWLGQGMTGVWSDEHVQTTSGRRVELAEFGCASSNSSSSTCS